MVCFTALRLAERFSGLALRDISTRNITMNWHREKPAVIRKQCGRHMTNDNVSCLSIHKKES